MVAVVHPAKPDFAEFLTGVDAWVWTLAGRYVRRYGGEIEDVRQEIVLHMLRLYDGYDPARGAPTTWTTWRFRSWVGWTRRKASFAKRRPLGTVGEMCHPDGEQLDVADPRAGDPADLAADRDEVARLTTAMGRLHRRYRETLTRRFGLDGRAPESLDTIGRAMGVTREAVRQTEMAAMAKLADAVLEW